MLFPRGPHVGAGGPAAGACSAARWRPSPRCSRAWHAPRPVVPVRDSKDPARGALVFDAAAWSCFVAAVKQDQDRP
ncbi:DUF397 domain-containing protein [Streptomyces sp. ID05-47C]|uniref:DUF397 domain-containing protein n=1 Tax=Streptomyces sp. ID05-47C TaxID=3028665 RepID=UPI0039F5FDEC